MTRIEAGLRGWMHGDKVDHPPHYNQHPGGIECIDVVEHMNFNLGNAVKYIWRAGLKSPDALTDLEKARWYIEREMQRLLSFEKKADGNQDPHHL